MTGLAPLRAALLALLAVLALAGPAAAAPASLTDVEDEVLCVVCGTPLNVAQGKPADDQRALIRGWIAEGLDKREIKQRLEVEYGPAVLGTGAKDGLGAPVWGIPALGGLLGLALVLLVLRRWRRGEARPEPEAADPVAAPVAAGPLSARLDAELRAADGR